MSDRPSQAEWLAAVHGLQQHGSEYHGPCPCCSGSDRFRVLADGAAFCRQCDASIADLRHAAGLNGTAPPRRIGNAAPRGEPSAVWELRDHGGEIVAIHKRFDQDNGEKVVAWYRPDGAKGLGGRTLKSMPLYGIHREPSSRCPPVLTEGEKAADALHRVAGDTWLVLGTVTGAAATPGAKALAPVAVHATDHLVASPVYLWPDNDDEGRRHMQRIAKALLAAGAQVRIIDWEGAPAKGDAADWVAAGQQPSLVELREAATAPELDSADEPEPTKKNSRWAAVEGAVATAPVLRRQYVHVAGSRGWNGWYWRPEPRGLWRAATKATMFRAYQNLPERERFSKDIRSDSVVSEWSGQLEVNADLLNADDWLCGLPDGSVLDLRTGAVRQTTDDDYITMALAVVPEPGVPALWLRVLGEQFSQCGDLDGVVTWFRWWCRMALTGNCEAQAFSFLFGPPNTGKSKIAETLLHIWGDYGTITAGENLIGNANNHRSWMADLQGRRLVVLEDAPEGRWNTNDLNPLVDGAEISANRMRQDVFRFRSQAHVLATGNHAPRAGGNAGLWRRLRAIDCRREPPNPDPQLGRKLQAESGQILAWLLDTPIEQPPVPDAVRGLAETARHESDPITAWLRDHYVRDRGAIAPSREIYDAYCATLDVDTRQPTPTTFGRKLTEQYGPDTRKTIAGRLQRCRMARKIA